MGRRPLVITAVVAVTLLNPALAVKFDSSDEDVVVNAHMAKFNHNSHHTAKEWIEAPNGFLYQFHSGSQSWLAAREFCLSQNSDLVTLRDREQIDWLLSHYAPTYPRFSERFIQIGLLLPETENRDWIYVNGSKYDQSLISWIFGEPSDHSADGKERCALLRVHSRLLDDVDCELASRSRVRFICERDSELHKKQQRSSNYLWDKLEQLMKYFQIWTKADVGNQSTKNASKHDNGAEGGNVTSTSSERELFKKNIIMNETSEEEEVAVLAALKKLGKPGKTVELRRKEQQGRLEFLKTSPFARPKTSPVTTAEEIKKMSAMDKGTRVLSKAAVDSSKEAAKETSGSPSNETLHTEQVVTREPVVVDTTITIETGKSAKKMSVKTVKDSSALAHAAPLREISVEEGSGVEVESKHLEGSEKHYHEIEPEKLGEIINTMERMIDRLENLTLVGKKNEEEAKLALFEGTTTEVVVQNKEEDIPKQKKREKVAGISEKQKADRETLLEMEKDFDEELNKNMPTTDIRPKNDDDCEEASGENSTDASVISRNRIDEEDDDNLSQKPKIPVEREEHVQEFLQTLRTFLSRAEHTDLRKLLDENPGKTLLQKMKLAIAAANEREFSRFKELETMKQNGIDVSNVPDPVRMSDTVREELFRKIRGVVIAEAEKLDLRKDDQTSARTTTEETLGTTTMAKNEKQSEDNEIWDSKEYLSQRETSEKKTTVKKGSRKEKIAASKEHAEEHDEQLRKMESSTAEAHTKHFVKKEAQMEKAEEKVLLENSERKKEVKVEKNEEKVFSEKPEQKQQKSIDEETTPARVETPARTKQLKEFDNKFEIISKESDELPEKESEERTESVKRVSEQQEKSDLVDMSMKSFKHGERNESGKVGELIMSSPEGRNHDSEEEVGTERAILTTTNDKVKNEDNDSEEEVGTEKTPHRNDTEAKQKISEKEKIEKMEHEEKQTPEVGNPLGLPTLPPLPPLPPLPTLPPLPSVKDLFDNLTREWQKLLKHPKSLFKN